MAQSISPRKTKLFTLLWVKQAGCCALCGKPMPENRYATEHATIWRKLRPTMDHILAKAAGGTDSPDNFQLAHADCNRRKGHRAWEKRKRRFYRP